MHMGSVGGGSGHERSAGGSRGQQRRCSGSVGALALSAVGSAVDLGAGGPAAVEETVGRKAKQQMRAMTRGLNSITAYAAYG